MTEATAHHTLVEQEWARLARALTRVIVCAREVDAGTALCVDEFVGLSRLN